MGLVDLSRFVMDLTCVRLLLILGLVVAAQAQSCAKPVPGANMGLKDSDILLDTFPNNTVVSFICDVGYTTAGGSRSITCEDGNWSPVKLKCQRKSCGPAGEVENGNIDYSEGTEFGDRVVASCNTGYTLVGKADLRCGAEGWKGRLPTCEVITCAPPRGIENGDFSPKKEEYYDYLQVIRYACQINYSLRGSKELTCSEDGVFKPDPPECIIVNCEDPVVDFAKLVEGSRPPHKHLGRVTFECNTGYEMVGEMSQICDINSTWSPGLPKCILSATTKATTTTTTTKTTTTTTTTTTPSGKQTAAPKPTEKPGSGSDGFKQYGVPILITIGVIFIAGVIFILIKRKRGSQRSYPDSEAPKQGEGIPLSQ